MVRTTFKTAMFAVGLALIGLAIFATKLGIDHDATWGAGRKLSLILGGSILVAVSYSLISRTTRVWKTMVQNLVSFRSGAILDRTFMRKLAADLDALVSRASSSVPVSPHMRSRLARVAGIANHTRWRLSGSQPAQVLSRSRERAAALTAWGLFVAIGVIYLWIVSVGRWNDWPDTTDYYDQLGEGFIHGQTYLLTQPRAELLRLSDPYEHALREGIFFPWDVSLHDGRYYLYWGPVPGLIVAVLKSFTSLSVGDQNLVFGFSMGSLFFAVLLLLSIFRDHFDDLPWWTLAPGVLVVGLANPIPWLLNRPAIYEAATAGGQFFWIAGLYWAYKAQEDGRLSSWKLGLAGVSWVAAVATRSSLAPAVTFSAAMVLVQIWQLRLRDRLSDLNWRAAVSFVAPLWAGAVALGWYNYARFGSVFEFGHRYQLTGMNLHRLYGFVISSANVLPNLYNYLLNPLRTLSVFPYVKPDWGGRYIWPFYMPTPEHYYTEQVTGTLYSVPFVWFSAIPIGLVVLAAWNRMRATNGRGNGGAHTDRSPSVRWLIATLLGATVLLFAPILLFVAASMRYLGDVIPSWIILSTLGFWQGYRLTAANWKHRRVFLALTALLVLITVTLGLLLAITGYQARFEKLNPVLFEQITRLLTW